MKYAVVLMLILGVPGVSHAKQDANIISILVGDGPSGIDQTPIPASSSSSTESSSSSSCGSPGNSQCHGHSGDSTTTNTTNNTQVDNYPGNANPRQGRGLVVGVLYQRRIADSPLLLGAMIQSNKTYSAVLGVSF